MKIRAGLKETSQLLNWFAIVMYCNNLEKMFSTHHVCWKARIPQLRTKWVGWEVKINKDSWLVICICICRTVFVRKDAIGNQIIICIYVHIIDVVVRTLLSGRLIMYANLIPTTTLKSSSSDLLMYLWKSKYVWLWGAKCAWKIKARFYVYIGLRPNNTVRKTS